MKRRCDIVIVTTMSLEKKLPTETLETVREGGQFVRIANKKWL